MLTVKSTINIAGQTVPQIIPVVQGDTGRAILFTLADFTIPQDATATYYIQKPSGEAVYNVATIDGNTVLVELTAQSIIEAGDNYGQVRIESDGEIVTSFDFILLVKPFRGIDAVESTTDMNIFDKAVEQAEEAIDEAKVEALEEIAQAGSGNIAEEFDAANSYLAGEYTIYEAKLYRFTSNHTGLWTGSDAEEVTVGDELTDINEELTEINEDLTDVKSDLTAVGTYEYPYALVNGAYNTSDGEPTASTNYRIRTNDFISVEDFASASTPSGYGVIVFAWNNSAYLGASVASYSYATSCTAKEIKDKFPTATRVKVAFSNLSSQSITAIKWKTYGLSIVCKSNVETSISDQYETGENLVDFRTLRDGTSISTSTGAESLNADRWTSDFIPYDAVNHPKLIYTKRILASCIAYDSSKTYIANITSNALIDSVPDNTAYLRICGVKTTVTIADAPHRVFVGYADVASGLTAHKMLNDSYYGVKRRGYINLNSITPYAESDGTYKTSFELTIERTEESYKNMILGIRAKYVGTDAPSITFKYYFTTTNEAYNIYASKPHTFGGNGCYEVNEFRNPPFPKYKMSLAVIVTIPTETTVYIDDLWNEYSDRVGGYDVGVRMNAHQGFIPLCIADTLSSFRMAGKLGFNRCVTIPKETSDGVLVCYHNDGAIGTTLVDGNGNHPDATTQAKKISEITYSELSGYYVSAPNRLSSIYQDEKVPTLEEFFAVCSRTGMHPMLSVHPEPTLAGWNNIKTLAIRYGLLNSLNIKIGYALTATSLDNPYAVFGSDIESYVIDVSTSGMTGTEYAQYLDTHLPNCKCRVVVEYFYSVITDTRISQTLAGGYEVACAEMATQPTSEYKRLMALGVTEFTNDNFSSVGLNW